MVSWCQNPKCPDKKTSGQIRGNKGNKWYQSNRVGGYGGGNFCTLHCHDQWSNEYMSQAIDALNVRIHEPVKVYLDDAWFVQYKWGYYDGDDNGRYVLTNKLKGVKQVITKQQAQTPKQIIDGHDWRHIDDTQAKELAVQLGLAS